VDSAGLPEIKGFGNPAFIFHAGRSSERKLVGRS